MCYIYGEVKGEIQGITESLLGDLAFHGHLCENIQIIYTSAALLKRGTQGITESLLARPISHGYLCEYVKLYTHS